MRHYLLHIFFLHNQDISRKYYFLENKDTTLTTHLADPLTAKKKFINSLTYYKKYLGDTQESSPDVHEEESRIVRSTYAVKRGRAVSRVRKIKPIIRKQTIVVEEEQAMQAEVDAELLSEMKVNESRVPHPTITMKRGRAVSHVRKIKPTLRKRKRTRVFTVHETVAEEEDASFEPENVVEEEITPEQFVNMDVNKLSEDDFYKLLGFLESEKKKLGRITRS